MALNWMKDFSSLDANTLLLLEECQINWIDETYNGEAFAKIFAERPYIAWYFSHKAPMKAKWVEETRHKNTDMTLAQATEAVMRGMEDWVVYVTDPDIYANQPFVSWDERELTSLTDWAGKRVVDIGSGTGKQAFSVAKLCDAVYCVEPVSTLRDYLRKRAIRENQNNVHVVDGFLERIPFEDEFADVTMGGHVYGDNPEREVAEFARVTKKGGMMIFIPGGSERAIGSCEHNYLVENGFDWARFEEPGDGIKLKYWKIK